MMRSTQVGCSHWTMHLPSETGPSHDPGHRPGVEDNPARPSTHLPPLSKARSFGTVRPGGGSVSRRRVVLWGLRMLTPGEPPQHGLVRWGTLDPSASVLRRPALPWPDQLRPPYLPLLAARVSIRR